MPAGRPQLRRRARRRRADAGGDGARHGRASATWSAAINWTFAELFGRLERLTKVPAPDQVARRAAASRDARAGGRLPALGPARRRVEPQSVEMARALLVLRLGQGGARARLRPARRDRHAVRHREVHPRALLERRARQEGSARPTTAARVARLPSPLTVARRRGGRSTRRPSVRRRQASEAGKPATRGRREAYAAAAGTRVIAGFVDCAEPHAQRGRDDLEHRRQAPRRLAVELDGDAGVASTGAASSLRTGRADGLELEVVAAVEAADFVSTSHAREVAHGDDIERAVVELRASGQIFMPPPKKRPLPTAAISTRRRSRGRSSMRQPDVGVVVGGQRAHRGAP